MALVVRDRVKETSTTTGTGTFTLAGAVTGFESFASVGNSNTTYYCCTDNTDFEIGIGTYTSSGTTLSRDTILQSSNSDSKVDWGAGTRTIFCTYPADKAVFEDASGHVSIPHDLFIAGGLIDLKNDGGAVSQIKFYCESSNAHAQTLIGAPHSESASNTLTLPSSGGNAKLVSTSSTATLTNKSLTAPILTGSSSAAGSILFKEDTDNGTNAVTLIGPASTADVTVTLPAATDTLVGKATTDTLTNKSIDSDNNTITNIVNADIKSSAAIADTKLDTISTAGKVAISALDIDGGTDIGAALADADEIIVDDGGGGTNRRSDMSRVKTYIADVTLTTAAQTNITSLGTLTGLTVSGDVTFTGDNYNAVWDKSDDALEFADNAKLTFGADGDLEISHDGSNSLIKDTGTGRLRICGSSVQLRNAANDENMITGLQDGAVNIFHNGSAKITTSSTGVTVTGVVTADGFTIGSAVIAEAELEQLDGITAGTVAASKAVVVDSNKDVASFRNVTLTGELDAATGDFSGDVDVDGTLEADAITVNGTALNTVIADEATALAIALG